jgi:cytochrome c-type biogenesis protein CcmE
MKNIVWLFIIVCLFLIGIFHGVSYYRDLSEIENNSNTVGGIIINSKVSYKRSSKQNIVTFQYMVNDKIYTYTSTYDTILRIGDSCIVRYSILNPSNCQLVRGKE